MVKALYSQASSHESPSCRAYCPQAVWASHRTPREDRLPPITSHYQYWVTRILLQGLLFRTNSASINAKTDNNGTQSTSSDSWDKMKAFAALVLCSVVGSSLGYYIQREAPYNVGPNDPYSVVVDPNFLQVPNQRLFWGNTGTNQVGGTGLWATLTNKFPILATMFGRMELPQEYGVPQYNYQPQYYVPQQYYPQYVGQNYVPPSRDVGFTDDAVIVTPPHVPIAQPAPVPSEPATGYQYNKPQYRLELPHK